MTGHLSPTRRKSTISERSPSYTRSPLHPSPLANGIRDTTINVATAFSKAGLQPSQQKYTIGSYLSPSLSYDYQSHRYSSNDLTLSPSSKQHPFSVPSQSKQKNLDNITLGRSIDDKAGGKNHDDSIGNSFEQQGPPSLNPMTERRRRRPSTDLRRWSSGKLYFTPQQSRTLSENSSFYSLASPPDNKTKSDNDDSPPHLTASHPRFQLAMTTTAEMALFWIFCLFWSIKEIAVYLITLVCVIVCTIFLNPVVFILRCLGFRFLGPLQTPYLKPPFRDESSGSYGRIWLVSVLLIALVLIMHQISPIIVKPPLTTTPSRTTNKVDRAMMERLDELETTVNDLVKHFEKQDQQNEQQVSAIHWHLDQLKDQLTQWSSIQSKELELSLMEHGQKIDQALASTTMEWAATLEKWESRIEQDHSPDFIDELRHVFLLKSEQDDAMPWSTFLQLFQPELDQTIQRILDDWIQQQGVDEETLQSQLQEHAMTPTARQIIRGWIDTALAQDHQVKGGDYALASRGAMILPLWTSTTFTPSINQWWARWYNQGTVMSPRVTLTPGLSAGQCWPMAGTFGSLGIRLSEPIIVQGITVEYPSRAVMANQMSSAPKHMDIWGIARLDDLDSAVFLGSVTYQITPDATTRQTFELDNSAVYPGVVVRVRSNWGHRQYTCLYRVRIHGTPVM